MQQWLWMQEEMKVQELYEQEEKKDSTSTEDMDIEEAPPRRSQ
jgi:hypothetical protein